MDTVTQLPDLTPPDQTHAYGVLGVALNAGPWLLGVIPHDVLSALGTLASMVFAGVFVPIGVAWVQSKTREAILRRKLDAALCELETLKTKGAA